MRPNGGILGRGFEGLTIPIIGITFYGPPRTAARATPCSPERRTCHYPTVDVAQQYDFLGGDAPARPLEPLAFANSIAAYVLLHGNVPNRSIAGVGQIPTAEVIYQDTYGDTTLLHGHRTAASASACSRAGGRSRAGLGDSRCADAGVDRGQVPPRPQPRRTREVPAESRSAIRSVSSATCSARFRSASTTPCNKPAAVSVRSGRQTSIGPFGVGGPVYDKTTGVRTTDNIGIPTVPVILRRRRSIQTLGAPETGDDNKLAIEAERIRAMSSKTSRPRRTRLRTATKPEPFAKLRESLKFDPSKPLSGLVPTVMDR